MKLIPLLHARDMKEAIAFYTKVLDFTLKHKETTTNDLVVDLINADAELQLTSLEGSITGIAVNVRVNEVDDLFKRYLQRGLITPKKENSPVHEGPINQTWGMREFYITDPSGNTLRFGKVIE